jgi:hypothetical protein
MAASEQRDPLNGRSTAQHGHRRPVTDAQQTVSTDEKNTCDTPDTHIDTQMADIVAAVTQPNLFASSICFK